MEKFLPDACEDKFNSTENEADKPISNSANYESGDAKQKNDEFIKNDKLSLKEDIISAEVKIVETVSSELQDPVIDTIDSELSDNGPVESTANCIVSEAIPSEEKGPSLEDLASSDYILNRQVAAKSILKYLQQAGSDEEVLSVISVLCKLSVDEEFVVRSELVENFPSIALFCKTRQEDLGTVITQLVVPCTIKLLTDDQIQVRKMGHTTFLVLLEHNIIDHSQLSGWICPLISELVISNTSDEAKIEDVSIMCKMIQYVGKDLTIKFFLEPFILLCSYSSVLSIRKVCAATFGILSKTVGEDITEKMILPAFLDRCSEEDATIIKKCAEVFPDVASVVCDKTRREVLSPMFITLLNDNTHFVQQAAYQSLGAFIATFADSSKSTSHGCITAIPNVNERSTDQNVKGNETLLQSYHSNVNIDTIYPKFFERQNGCTNNDVTDKTELVAINKRKSTNVSNLLSPVENCTALSNVEISKDSIVENQLCDVNSNCKLIILHQKNVLKEDSLSYNFQTASATEKRHLHPHCDNENLYNNFQYWRTPLPEIELDIDVEEINDSIRTTNANSNLGSDNCSQEQIRVAPDFLTNSESKSVEDNCTVLDEVQKEHDEVWFTKTGCIFISSTLNQKTFKPWFDTSSVGQEIHSEMGVTDQDIVPADLLEKYIGIALSTTNTEEGPIHCAYNFPAVAYTLGKKYWPVIRKVHSVLARDITYAVRKSIASSLHTLTEILEYDDIVSDLLPVFLDMLKDVDAVRIKCLTNLNLFLRMLEPEDRRCFLPLIRGLLVVDCEHNWRFRYSVAKELLPCVKLFSSSEVHDHFMCVPVDYLSDKVSDVRLAAVDLMAEIIKSIEISEHMFLLYYLDTQYRQANKWLKRQTYIFLCEKIAVRKSVPVDVYIERMASKLLLLANDSVPNIRLALSRCLSLTLLPLGYISSIQKSCYSDLLSQVMISLRNDVDKDVRHFAQLSEGALNFSQVKLSPI